MSAKKIWSGLLKRLGIDKALSEAQGWNPIPFTPPRRRVPRRRSRGWHPDVRMRRGIEAARAARQRPYRLADIRESQLQALAVAEIRRLTGVQWIIPNEPINQHS